MATVPKDILSPAGHEAWTDYVRYHRERGHSPATIANCAGAVTELAKWLAAERPGRCVLAATRGDISDFLLWYGQKGQGRARGSVRNRHAALRGWYRFCADEEIIGVSPMVKVAAPSADYRVPEVLSDAQLLALIGTCQVSKGSPAPARLAGLRDEAVIRVLCEPGSPRAAEMAALDLADVDMEADTITIRFGKNRRTRQIAMSPPTARAVARWRRARAGMRQAAGSDAMWLGPKGRLTRFGLRQMLARRGKAAGIGAVFPHQLRHTAFADFDAASSGHTNAEMALFGWSSPAMAYHYGRAVRERAALATAQQLARGSRLGSTR